MVNDQLLRIHQMKLLSMERISPKAASPAEGGSPKTTDDTRGEDRPIINDDPMEANQSQAAAAQSMQIIARHDSSSAASDDMHELLMQQEASNDGRASAPASPGRPQTRLTGMEKVVTTTTTTPIKRQNSNCSAGSATTRSSAKKRSSWRYLLTPSYKSRSAEFHKLFCDTIPKNERLIADYACALHREILIQGRVYISVNYIAFYSNLFGWITKLIFRLRDVAEICKANTARIIPNAIQIVTKDGEKRVFASFVQRDKSYIMMLRMWQNNLMNERMSDQEIINLLYFSYGNDLGMGDNNEELKINSPDPVTPANVASAAVVELARPATDETIDQVDRNNNSSQQTESDDEINHRHHQHYLHHNQQLNSNTTTTTTNHLPARRRSSESLPVAGRTNYSPAAAAGEIGSSSVHEQQLSHTRYNSLDYQSARLDDDHHQGGLVSEVANKLNDFLAGDAAAAAPAKDDLSGDKMMASNLGSHSPALSSPVVVDTPAGIQAGRLSRTTPNSFRDHNDFNDAHLERQPISRQGPETSNSSGSKRDSLGASSTETQVPSEHNHHKNQRQQQQHLDSSHLDDDDEDYLVTSCDCGEHEGQLMADEQFDINIDTLFTLIFTDSKFKRAHMIKKGITNPTIGGWRRSSATSGNRSSSSTLSADGRSLSEAASKSTTTARKQQQQRQPVRRKQVRQLNYSVSIDHMWAKQVQVEEKQNIRQAKPGVYVLKSESVNSGIPYGDTFSVNVIYCLTRCGSIDRSRMVVHGWIKFIEKQTNWKLAMLKPMIERQSLHGIRDFVGDLIVSVKEYISETMIERNRLLLHCDNTATPSSPLEGRDQSAAAAASDNGDSIRELGQAKQSQSAQFKRNSLARAKSKLKERKLRNIYRYYINNQREDNDDDYDDDDDHNDDDHDDDDDDDNDVESGVSRRGSSLMAGRNQDTDGGMVSNSESSLLSASDFDDNSSMIMMRRGTDDGQVSDAATSVVSNLGDFEMRADKSFSDVNVSSRRKSSTSGHHHQHHSISNNGRRHQPASSPTSEQQQRKQQSGANCGVGGGNQLKLPVKSWSMQRNRHRKSKHSPGGANGRHQQRQSSHWSRRYFAEFRSRLGASWLSSKNIASSTIMTLLVITLLAMILQHAIVLRRLDSLERRLEVKCEQQLSLPSISSSSSSSATRD